MTGIALSREDLVTLVRSRLMKAGFVLGGSIRGKKGQRYVVYQQGQANPFYIEISVDDGKMYRKKGDDLVPFDLHQLDGSPLEVAARICA